LDLSDGCGHVDFDDLDWPHKKGDFDNIKTDIGNSNVAFEGSIGDSSGKGDGISFAHASLTQKHESNHDDHKDSNNASSNKGSNFDKEISTKEYQPINRTNLWELVANLFLNWTEKRRDHQWNTFIPAWRATSIEWMLVYSFIFFDSYGALNYWFFALNNHN
jgi:hypothetical protein